MSTISVAPTLRQKLLLAQPHARLDPEKSSPCYARWRAGNLVSLSLLKASCSSRSSEVLGERWSVASLFFGVGLLLLLLWSPRKIEILPTGVR